MTAKSRGIDPALLSAVSKMLREVMKDPEATIVDKVRVIDRALKLEQIKQRIPDTEFGSGFASDEKGD